MKQIIIEGGHKLEGTIEICGAKNSAVALIPAAILSDGLIKIDNVPNISDIDALSDILRYLDAKIDRQDTRMIIDSSTIVNKAIPEEKSKKLRASYYFMGALLGKYKKVEMYFPGGCSIGNRPINLHLKGFEALGAKIINEKNKFVIEAEELVGSKIYLDMASVGATINIMFAAVKAKGMTIIDNAAKEPEIVNVATFLNQLGAKITGAGTSQIKIIGVERLDGGIHEVIPDRIEAGTYLLAGALCGENLKVTNIIPEHLESLTSKLQDMGSKIEIGSDYIIISKTDFYKPTSIETAVYPGFPTDLQQPFSVLMTQAKGESKIEENIWENRYMHVKYLNEMGSSITIDNRTATIIGPTKLIGKEVIATDLRAGAAMILAGLIADGNTTIKEVEHILRGYENIVGKLNSVGGKLRIEEY